MNMAAILQLINVLVPLGVQVVMDIKKNASTGATDIQLTISQTDAAFTADIKQATDALAGIKPV